MHLQTNKFAMAGAWAMGIVYIVCAIFVALLPGVSATLLSWLTHITNLDRTAVTWTGALGGLVQVVVYTYVVAYIFAKLHNKFVK